MPYRIASNECNLSDPPWRGAIGVEYIEPDEPKLSVPSLVCWFTRGNDAEELAQKVVDLLNARMHMKGDTLRQ